jgi:hypothetical protein
MYARANGEKPVAARDKLTIVCMKIKTFSNPLDSISKTNLDEFQDND